ncbi:type II toxin-antitoxin system VapC family toxin [Blastococcus saxobsidens]|uniref:Ribonuclease VapC n=1 Tax=Blastococcus saxobsidens (strain DD2) TaxID=1146883 RepID=H6RM65_BLASD|nr:type II toxin-antitoxin system VapC family toxin [Blastococcus saxobsidens]CCG01307.1 PIN domain protein, Putative toxin of TAS system [Blastococcus saxobsidens DD2]
MIVYLDTSALLKRVIIEPESAAVRELLSRSAAAVDLLTSSALTWVEVERALRRADVPDLDRLTEAALSGIDEFPLRPVVLDRARTIGPATLRSLDAIHLASAIGIRATQLVTYDERLAAAARDEGIDVLASTS